MKKIKFLLTLLGVIFVSVFSAQAQLRNNQVQPRIVETLVVRTNELADSSHYVINLDGYKNFAIEINTSGGVTTKAYATLDESVSDTDTTGWVNYNNAFFNADSLVDAHVISYSGTSFSPTKIMLYFKNSDNSNYKKVIVAKY